MKIKLIFIFLFCLAFTAKAQIKILFDATKAEMASNADWVIDADTNNLKATSLGTYSTGGSDSNPQQIPTPAQSGITNNTPETYWKGALSAWAVDLVKLGYTVETLPYNGKITYGDKTNSQDLSNYKVFIIDEPNFQFALEEKNALVNFVKNGGGLFIISDHNISDRNKDGWDSPNIWNDFFSTNTVKTNPFGITFDLANISGATTNFANFLTNTILHGTSGTPTQMDFFNGTTMTLNTTNNPTVQGLIFKSGSSTTGLVNVMFATATYGTGKVCALGDSSVPDDGTGDSGDSLYNGYTGDANGNHRPLLLNATAWLATDSGLGLNDLAKSDINLEIFPNPSSDFIYIKNVKNNNIYNLTISDSTGKLVFSKEFNSNKIDIKSLQKGLYYLTIKTQNGVKSFKFIKK
ncbi:T9SS type A sorting domain-containing protein [Halpernia sp.]|uniref:T9SS type A sorting domain-containing protein n=1 Tax=Halpernia sp. TaxID=2782209 RepID=UPI003A90B495